MILIGKHGWPVVFVNCKGRPIKRLLTILLQADPVRTLRSWWSGTWVRVDGGLRRRDERQDHSVEENGGGDE